MQTTNLTWKQARNALVTGVAQIVRYTPGKGNRNSFVYHEGTICRVYDEHRVGNRSGSMKPGNPDSVTCETFVIMH